MTGPRAFIGGLLGALAFVASAAAADMPGGWEPPAQVVPRFSELMSGWYLRFDGGYSWNNVGSVASATPVTGTKYQNSPDVTAGFGLKYQFMRFEVTVDRGFPSAVTASTGLVTAQQPQYSAKVGWLALLGSAYIDFGTWSGFTPYIGAGAGGARLHGAGYTDNGMPPTSGSPNSQKSNFAWAAMAGVAFQVSPSWMVDIGYRYLDLGELQNTTGTNLPIDHTTFKSITAQQVRVGLRFMFD